jgi:hypothetical protein
MNPRQNPKIIHQSKFRHFFGRRDYWIVDVEIASGLLVQYQNLIMVILALLPLDKIQKSTNPPIQIQTFFWVAGLLDC